MPVPGPGAGPVGGVAPSAPHPRPQPRARRSPPGAGPGPVPGPGPGSGSASASASAQRGPVRFGPARHREDGAAAAAGDRQRPGGAMTGEKKKKKRLNRSVLLAKKIVIRDGAGVSAGLGAVRAEGPGGMAGAGTDRSAAAGPGRCRCPVLAEGSPRWAAPLKPPLWAPLLQLSARGADAMEPADAAARRIPWMRCTCRLRAALPGRSRSWAAKPPRARTGKPLLSC